MTVLRSALFHLWFVLVSVTMNVGFLPILIMPWQITITLAGVWARLILWGLRVFAGTRLEIRGQTPKGGVLVASKHFSMWETIAFLGILYRPVIVMKRTLLRVPFYGWYAVKQRHIAIDRSAGASALRTMSRAAEQRLSEGRPVVIFPEGTRRNPGDPPAYKPGVAALYLHLDVPCVPVAHNSGLFWTGFLRRPGTIVLEYLEPIPPGLSRRDFMTILEQRIETATARLIAEGRRELAARS